MRRHLALLIAIAGMGWSSPTAAHDYWLTAEPPRPAPGTPTTLHMWVGQGMVPQDERPFEADRSAAFVHVRGAATPEEARAAGGIPLWSGPLEEGGHLFAHHRNEAFIELEAQKFDRYLAHEGLGSIIEARAARGESDQPGRERYQRYLKLWLQVGDARDQAHARTVGHELELRLLDRPTAGARLRVEVHFRGAPLPGFPLTAFHDGKEDLSLESDAEGHVTLPGLTPGTWLVRGVHMVRADHPRADWESFWGAYSFHVGPNATPRPGPVSSPGGGCAGCAAAPSRPSGSWGWAGLALMAALRLRGRRGSARAHRQRRPGSPGR